MKRVAILGLGLAIAAQGIAADASTRVRAVDDTGAEVVLVAPARRIVSLAPHATELLYAAGAGTRIVGTVKGSDYPRAARSLAVVGDVQALDIERIVALRPDLVVTWRYTVPSQVASLKAFGITVFTTDPRSIDGIATNIERLGTLAGTGAAASAAAIAFRSVVGQASAEAKAVPRARGVRVFYQIWDRPLFTIGGHHLIAHAIRACGGDNVFADLALPAPQVSVEAVLAARPDAIIAGSSGAQRPAWIDEWRRWPDLPAAKNDQLYVVDADLLHRTGPRFAAGLAQLCAAIARVPRGR